MPAGVAVGADVAARVVGATEVPARRVIQDISQGEIAAAAETPARRPKPVSVEHGVLADVVAGVHVAGVGGRAVCVVTEGGVEVAVERAVRTKAE